MLTPFSKGNNRFMVFCDFCKKKFHGSIKISKNNRAYSMRVNGANFHHLDGNPENDIVETLEWKTSILKAHDGTEQRIKVRQSPRQYFRFMV